MYRIVEHNCAIWAVAQRYGQACTSEIDFIRTVLPEATSSGCSTWSPAPATAPTRCARHAEAVSDDSTADIRVLIDDVLTHGSLEARGRLERRLQAIAEQLLLGDDSHTAADQALTYLEADPYYFWSGYARARIARRFSPMLLSILVSGSELGGT